MGVADNAKSFGVVAKIAVLSRMGTAGHSVLSAAPVIRTFVITGVVIVLN